MLGFNTGDDLNSENLVWAGYDSFSVLDVFLVLIELISPRAFKTYR